jgi:hypothetical protein
LSQTQTDGQGNSASFGNGTISDFYLAQAVTPSTSVNVSDVAFLLGTTGPAASNILVEVENDCSGVPCGTVLATSNGVAETSLPQIDVQSGTGAYTDFPFSSPYSLNAGTKYWLVLVIPGANSNISWGSYDGSGDNTSGEAMYKTGTTWVDAGADPQGSLMYTVNYSICQ